MRVNKLTPEYMAGIVGGTGLGMLIANAVFSSYDTAHVQVLLSLAGPMLITIGSFWVYRVQSQKEKASADAHS